METLRYTQSCDCSLSVYSSSRHEWFVCPLHEAAPALLAALEAIRRIASTDPTNLPQKMFAGDIAARATAAIEQTKGETND